MNLGWKPRIYLRVTTVSFTKLLIRPETLGFSTLCIENKEETKTKLIQYFTIDSSSLGTSIFLSLLSTGHPANGKCMVIFLSRSPTENPLNPSRYLFHALQMIDGMRQSWQARVKKGEKNEKSSWLSCQLRCEWWHRSDHREGTLLTRTSRLLGYVCR